MLTAWMLSTRTYRASSFRCKGVNRRTRTIQISQDTKDLAKLIYSEAGNQSLEGQQAVANAVANRVNLWGKSVNTVIYMKYTDGTKYQFNGVEGREWNDAGTLIDNSDASINPIIDLAQNTIDGSLADITGGATFFRNPAKATNAWFQGKIDSGAFIETNSIGSHVFYREKKYDRK